MSYSQNECTSCGNLIKPNENAIEFKCPDCNDVSIIRCERCRMFARNYKCQKCEFVGP